MIWLTILRKFWTIPAFAVLIGLLWWQGAQVTKVRKQSDAWHSSALAYQVSASEWEASFRQAEKARQSEQDAAVGAVNASEASCDARVAKARSSAIKIDKIVSKVPMECKPGESLPRVLADPSDVADALGLRR